MTTDNKSIVRRALGGLMENRDVEAVAPFLSDDFRHHRPDAATSTKKEWLAAVGAALDATGGMRIEMLHLIDDGEYVVVHSRRGLPHPGPRWWSSTSCGCATG